MTKPTAPRVIAGASRVGLAVTAILAATAQTHAQDAPASAALEEVVVTAERRDINLQDVPASATVLTADMLARQGVKNIGDIQQVAPAVAVNTYNRGTFVNIRGVGIAQSAPTSNPGVAFYIDGNFIPHETFIGQAFYDIDSIEVLRGPQGTLTGQNSTGGAVYMRTPNPDTQNWKGYVDLTGGDYGYMRAVGAVNIPLADVLGIRLSGVYDDRDSFTDNIGPSASNPGAYRQVGGRAAIRFKPTDGMTFDLRYEHFDLHSGYNAVKNRDDAVTKDPFTIEEDARSFLNQSGYRASLEARIDLSSTIQFRALTSYLDAENFDQADGDRTATALPVPPNLPPTGANSARFPGRVGYTAQSFRTSVSEINLLSTGNGDFQWVAGAFYLDETTPTQVLRDNKHTTDFVVSNSTIDTKAVNTSKSVFGQIDYKFNSAWAVDAGVRYSEDNQDYTRYALPGPTPSGCFPCTSSADSDETTGRVGVKYYATDDVMLYSTLSRGYKAGGNNLDPSLGAFGPETNDVLELGAKTTLSDKRLRINGDVFYSKYDGIQLSALTPVGPGNVLTPNTLNGPLAKMYGAEIEFTGQYGGFAFNAGANYLHSDFDETALITTTFPYPTATSAPNTNLPVGPGSPVPFAPKYSFNGGVQYDFLIGEGTLTPRIQMSYLDKQYATPFPDPKFTLVPSHTIADVRLTYVPTAHLTLEAFCSNVFDETYIAVQVQNASSAAGGYMYGAPRQYGARVKYAF
jgi:iron complex outermembrane recepter protein